LIDLVYVVEFTEVFVIGLSSWKTKSRLKWPASLSDLYKAAEETGCCLEPYSIAVTSG